MGQNKSKGTPGVAQNFESAQSNQLEMVITQKKKTNIKKGIPNQENQNRGVGRAKS